MKEFSYQEDRKLIGTTNFKYGPLEDGGNGWIETFANATKGNDVDNNTLDISR